MYNLRDYQILGKRLLYSSIKDGKRKVIYYAPTGTGKGLAMSDLVNDCIKKNKKVITVIKRRQLILQTRDNYQKYHKHEASVIMGTDKGYLHWSFNQVCSIDTIRQRMKQGGEWDRLKEFDIIIIDECHDTNSATYQEFFKWIDPDDKKIFIGLTATPFSMGGKPLLFWEEIVQPLTAAQARDRGYLVPDLTFIPKAQISLKGLELNSTGEYKEDQLAERAGDGELVGDVVKNWITHGKLRPTLVYCVNKEHSIKTTLAFNNAGFKFIHVDDQTTQKERDKAILDLKSGAINGICSIGVMSTGTDIPEASCVILFRSIMSLVLFVQIAGRGLRPFKICGACAMKYGGDSACIRCKSTIKSFNKEECIIFDHGGNIIRHGLVYEDRHAKLAFKGHVTKSRNNEAPNVRIVTCSSCFAVYHPSQPCCTQCGTINQVKVTVKEKSGELVLVDESVLLKLQLRKCQDALADIEMRKNWYNWKPNAEWFALHKAVGDVMFKFESELQIPSWFKSRIGIVEIKGESHG